MDQVSKDLIKNKGTFFFFGGGGGEVQYIMSIFIRKPMFEDCDKLRQKVFYSAKETSLNIEILHVLV